MPGPTNPWASELKKTRQRGGGNKPLLKGKEQKSSSLQHPDDAIKHQDETSRDEKSQDEKSLHETREAVITTTTNTMEKAAVDEVKKYVKVQDDDDDNAAAEVLRVANSTKKKESSSPPYSKVNNDDVIPTPKRLKKKVPDTNQNTKQQVSKSTSSVVVEDDSSSKKKVSPKVNETTITDAELPLKVRKKTVDANLPKEVSSGGTATKKVKSTLPDTVASKVNDTSVSPKGPKDSLAAVQLKKKSNDAAKPSSLNTNRCLYQDARSQLKPVASILSRQLSQEAKIDVVKVAAPDNDDETPVDRLIKQGSIEQPKG